VGVRGSLRLPADLFEVISVQVKAIGRRAQASYPLFECAGQIGNWRSNFSLSLTRAAADGGRAQTARVEMGKRVRDAQCATAHLAHARVKAGKEASSYTVRSSLRTPLRDSGTR
jgi:hypothetical protein